METAQMSSTVPREISVKAVILAVRSRVRYLLRNWHIIVICGLIGGGLGLAASLLLRPKYRAELSFVLEDSKSGGLAAYAGIASQFGIDLPGSGGTSGIFEGDNILTFLQSRLMIQRVLLSPMPDISGKPQSLAECYIDDNKLRKGWADRTELNNIKFPVGADPEKLSLLQDSVLQIIFEHVVKHELDVSKPEKKLSFIKLSYVGPNEGFARIFVIRLAREATDFYVEMKTQRSQASVDKLQAKADSVLAMLNQKTVQVASTQDLNINPVRKMAALNTEMATRDKAILMTMYGEIIKNLEIAKMSMAQETPIIQVVDTPILPLKKEKLGKLKGIVIGGLLAGILSVVFLLIARFYREVMEEDTKQAATPSK